MNQRLTSPIVTLAASFGLLLASAPAFADSVEVVGSNPKIVITIAHATGLGGKCSALTDADQEQIDRLSHVEVSAPFRIVPVAYKNPPPGMTALAYLAPASCSLYRSLQEMHRAGLDTSDRNGGEFSQPLEMLLHRGKSCVTGWGCADALSSSQSEGVRYAATSWTYDVAYRYHVFTRNFGGHHPSANDPDYLPKLLGWAAFGALIFVFFMIPTILTGIGILFARFRVSRLR